MVIIGNEWDEIIGEEFEKPYYKELRAFLKSEYFSRKIYPDMHDIFNALKYTPYNSVKAVILGQDPYHGPNQAHGLCFSVQDGVQPPPSLVNIYKELHADLGYEIPKSGNLTKWAKQGVLLLNTCLSVRAGQANSHSGKGWETFTDSVIRHLSARETPMVFILWGANARSKKKWISSQHLIIESAHPSPLSCYNGFWGSRPFSRTNEFLVQNGISPIDWDLTK